MARFRRKRSRGGGGGGSSGRGFVGFYLYILGIVAFVVGLIMYGIVLSTLDTAYTTISGYTWESNLNSIVGIWPMVLLVLFMIAGVAGISGGALINWKKGSSGKGLDAFMVFIMGGLSIVIGILMFNIANTQMNTLAVAINATTNIASFTGLYSMITIWPIVVFIVMMVGAASQIVAAGFGAYKSVRGSM